MNEINKVIKRFGARKIGGVCGVSGESVRKWGVKGCLPRTEHTGETTYAEKISGFSDGEFQVEKLLERPISNSAA